MVLTETQKPKKQIKVKRVEFDSTQDKPMRIPDGFEYHPNMEKEYRRGLM